MCATRMGAHESNLRQKEKEHNRKLLLAARGIEPILSIPAQSRICAPSCAFFLRLNLPLSTFPLSTFLSPTVPPSLIPLCQAGLSSASTCPPPTIVSRARRPSNGSFPELAGLVSRVSQALIISILLGTSPRIHPRRALVLHRRPPPFSPGRLCRLPGRAAQTQARLLCEGVGTIRRDNTRRSGETIPGDPERRACLVIMAPARIYPHGFWVRL